MTGFRHRSREQYEQEERERLAPWAACSGDSAGRLVPEPEHPYRTAFQRDRDRIVHARAFRRLEFKTQVFVHLENDHYRNRLTHTIEAAQIARTIARALYLNEDLAEAIVLAHDLGHTPFGHAGERVLDGLLQGEGGFDHNRQSLRIVDLLEERYPGFRGLNLSSETREGILKHGAAWEHPVPLPPETIVPLCAPALINGDHPIRKTRDLAFHTLIHGEVCLVGWRELIRRHRTVKLDISRGLLFDRSFMAISAAVDGLDVCL